MYNINLYDPSLRLKRDWTGAEASLALLALVAGAVAAAGSWVRLEANALQAPASAAATAHQTKQDALTALEAQHGGAKADAAMEQRLLGLQATLKHRLAALQMLGEGSLRQDNGYSAALLALARQSVDGLWLTGVAMDRGSMTLRGRTFRPELIAVYVGRLNGEAALRGHAFGALDVRRPLEEAATAVTVSATAPAPQPGQGAARRLAPYVEFTLTGGHEDGTDSAVAGDAGARASSADPAVPAGSRS